MRQAPEGAVLEKVIAVVGPTASGKTELAVDLARALGGEIISADSRQVYRRLDAGTAKPGPEARSIPHHMIDVAEPSETFDAGRFAREASAVLKDILDRRRRVVVAGGTGLYVRALLEGLDDMPRADAKVRERLAREGRARLHERLAAVDPAAAESIQPNNVQRVIRALEVHELTGRPISSFWKRGSRSSSAEYLLIDWPAAELKARIDRRARLMWPGMIAEVEALLKEGFSGLEPGFQSLGYREAAACARGELSRDEGLARLIRSTQQYAKRQRTWFRNQTPSRTVIRGGPRADMLAQAMEALEHETALPG